MKLSKFVNTSPTYYVEVGYNFANRFGWWYDTASEALEVAENADRNRELVVIFRGNKEITIEQLARYANEE